WHMTRQETAIKAIQNIIEENADGLRMGIMRFDDTGSNTEEGNNDFDGGFIITHDSKWVDCSVKDQFILDADGDQLTGTAYDDAIIDYKNFLKAAVNKTTLPANANTPLTETLAEAGLYFAQKESWFNTGVNYHNTDNYPMQYTCRQNYIILMTDGEPTLDNDPKLSTGIYINDDKITGNDNRAYLNHVAEYLYENDCNSHLDGTQNIITYPIGFAGGDEALLQRTADKGQGKTTGQGLYFRADSQQQLQDAFQAFIANINERQTTFTASVVPISDVSKAYAGDYVYMSLFQPVSGSSRWIGNLKKYKLDEDNEFASCDDNAKILDATGKILDGARSCWSTSDDGGSVNKGGAGGRLLITTDANRKIYSNIDNNNLSTDAKNLFSISNTSLTQAMIGATDATDRAAIINNVRMVNESWKLGDLNHSQPAVASYASGDRYIFVGSNDGMLHCFDDASGDEEWAFIPNEQLSRIKETYTGDHSYFIDGSPTIANVTSDQKIVIVGERRGGKNYYALDITDIEIPVYKYKVTTTGQSWKKPHFMKVQTSSSATEEVFLMTGGYDDDYDDSNTVTTPDGNSVFFIKATDGAIVKTFGTGDISTMTKSIVSASAIDMVDDGQNIVSHVYAGDMEGQLFGFRDKEMNGSWESLHLFTATSTGKKIFEEVDVVSEFISYYDETDEKWKTVAGEYVFFGTGDRADPLDTVNINYFYCVKNDWHTEDISVTKTVGDFTTLDDPTTSSTDDSEYVMLNFTDNKIQVGTADEKKAAKDALNKKYNRGWYIQLEGTGEKCLSAPIVYAGVVYFTTFTPEANSVVSDDPCETPPTGGTAKLYALDYKTGGAVFPDFHDDVDDEGEPVTTPTKNDRSKNLNQFNITIPPNPLLIITEKGDKLAIGPHTENVKSPAMGVNSFYWRQKN
ncbi:MAG: hypothetical protein HQK65_15235, partial [Desulfamplus sp.]|nr:hypothetical protein [Desulfamplus sp.]